MWVGCTVLFAAAAPLTTANVNPNSHGNPSQMALSSWQTTPSAICRSSHVPQGLDSCSTTATNISQQGDRPRRAHPDRQPRKRSSAKSCVRTRVDFPSLWFLRANGPGHRTHRFGRGRDIPRVQGVPSPSSLPTDARIGAEIDHNQELSFLGGEQEKPARRAPTRPVHRQNPIPL
jgi:hypothetical protein